MFHRILLPTDFSTSAEAAIALARRHYPQSARLLLHVLDPKRLAQEIGTDVAAHEKREAIEQAARRGSYRTRWQCRRYYPRPRQQLGC